MKLKTVKPNIMYTNPDIYSSIHKRAMSGVVISVRQNVYHKTLEQDQLRAIILEDIEE